MVNKVIIVGNVGNDPEVKVLEGGSTVCSFSIATNKKWTDKQGEKQEKVTWHKVVTWQKTAEICGEYLKKGRQVYVEGELDTRSYEDKEGVTKWTTEIVAKTVNFLGKKEEGVTDQRMSDVIPGVPNMAPTLDDMPDFN